MEGVDVKYSAIRVGIQRVQIRLGEMETAQAPERSLASSWRQGLQARSQPPSGQVFCTLNRARWKLPDSPGLSLGDNQTIEQCEETDAPHYATNTLHANDIRSSLGAILPPIAHCIVLFTSKGRAMRIAQSTTLSQAFQWLFLQI
jgi:hypothetical protein